MATAKKSYSDKLKDPRWQKKRLQILKRDKFTCVYCGDKETELHVHHEEYCGEPWEQKNDKLKTVCKHCHLVLDGEDKSANKISRITKIITPNGNICIDANVIIKDVGVFVFLYRYITKTNELIYEGLLTKERFNNIVELFKINTNG